MILQLKRVSKLAVASIFLFSFCSFAQESDPKDAGIAGYKADCNSFDASDPSLNYPVFRIGRDSPPDYGFRTNISGKISDLKNLKIDITFPFQVLQCRKRSSTGERDAYDAIPIDDKEKITDIYYRPYTFKIINHKHNDESSPPEKSDRNVKGDTGKADRDKIQDVKVNWKLSDLLSDYEQEQLKKTAVVKHLEIHVDAKAGVSEGGTRLDISFYRDENGNILAAPRLEGVIANPNKTAAGSR